MAAGGSGLATIRLINDDGRIMIAPSFLKGWRQRAGQ
jgi:hypothetical protein